MRLCVFDLDGTLGRISGSDDAFGGDGQIFTEAVCEYFGDVAVDTSWERYTDVTDTGIIRDLFVEHRGRHPTQAEHDEVCLLFLGKLQAAIHAGETEFLPTPGAIHALRALPAEHGWSIALATGGWRRSALAKLAWGGIDLDGHAQAFADDDVTREGILETARRRASESAGRAVERVVYVGDASWDVRTCRRLGWPFVGIAEGLRAERLASRGASHVLPDMRDLDALLRALAEARVPASVQ